ncbi:MAG: hypothetical protein DRR19_30420 [Candidatus Parabeggiatoa sp. nov. 1]|nr:MAG: hypothetical protein DRR19_30420 [Gammaproteobacteria bacterium]
MKNIGIIVLNWQGWQDTLACLESLQTLIHTKPISIIVCDNGSDNDSFAQILNWARQHYAPSEIDVRGNDHSPFTIHHSPFTIRHFFPLVLIQTGANLGFAGGNNVGIRYVLASQQYEYLWLLNNDTIVDAHALSALYEYAVAHPQFGLLGSTVIDAPNLQGLLNLEGFNWQAPNLQGLLNLEGFNWQAPNLQGLLNLEGFNWQVPNLQGLLNLEGFNRVQCAGGCRYLPWLTVFKPVLGGQLLSKVMQHDESIALDYVYGAAMFLKVAAVQEVGLLNEDYFLFYEELDYSQRLKQQGYQIGWCKNSWVYHKGSASVGSVRDGNRDKLRLANYYENLSTLKYTANFYPRLLPLVMVSRFVGKSAALISRGDFYLFAPLFRAYWDFILRCRHKEYNESQK